MPLTGTFILPENAAAGDVAGLLTGGVIPPGTTLSIVGTAVGLVDVLSDGHIIRGLLSLDFEGAQEVPFTLRQVNPETTNGLLDTDLVLDVTNVFEQPNLGNLSFSANSFIVGVPASGTINGATPGEAITATGLPSGIAINGPLRTWSWSGSGSAGSGSFTLIGSLADSSNSPHTSPAINYTISATSSSTLTLTSTPGAAPVTFDWSDPIHGEGCSIYWEVTNTVTPTYDANGFFSTPVIEYGIAFVDGEEFGNLDIALSGFSTWPGAGAFHACACVDNDSGAFTGPDGATYDRFPFSNTITNTVTTSVAHFETSTGLDKNNAITISDADNLTMTSTASGSNVCVAATWPAYNTKFTIEVTMNANASGGGSGVGFYDGSTDFSNALAIIPGASGGPNGITFTWALGLANIGYARNGISGGGNNFAANVTIAAGDKLHLEVDTVAKTVTPKFWDASAGAVTATGPTLTLTSQIPSQWVFFARGFKNGDSLTANLGKSAYSVTPAAGFNNIYA